MQSCASGLKHCNTARFFQTDWSFDKNHKMADSLKWVDDVGHFELTVRVKGAAIRV